MATAGWQRVQDTDWQDGDECMERLDREMKRFVWQDRKERKTKMHQCATKLFLAVTNMTPGLKENTRQGKHVKLVCKVVKEKPWSRKCFNAYVAICCSLFL